MSKRSKKIVLDNQCVFPRRGVVQGLEHFLFWVASA
jgi:hypothetical protein